MSIDSARADPRRALWPTDSMSEATTGSSRASDAKAPDRGVILASESSGVVDSRLPNVRFYGVHEEQRAGGQPIGKTVRGHFTSARYRVCQRDVAPATSRVRALKIQDPDGRLFTASELHSNAKSSFDPRLALSYFMLDRHPNLNVISDIVVHSNLRLLVIPWATSLRNYLLHTGASHRTITAEARLRLALNVAHGLVFLHSQDPPVLHLGIQPATVRVFLERGAIVAKLSDFGLSSREVLATPSILEADAKDWRAQSPVAGRHKHPRRGIARSSPKRSTKTGKSTPSPSRRKSPGSRGGDRMSSKRRGIFSMLKRKTSMDVLLRRRRKVKHDNRKSRRCATPTNLVRTRAGLSINPGHRRGSRAARTTSEYTRSSAPHPSIHQQSPSRPELSAAESLPTLPLQQHKYGSLPRAGRDKGESSPTHRRTATSPTPRADAATLEAQEVYFVSPEVAQELGADTQISAKSDCYSASMLLCWLLGRKEKDKRFLENMWIVRYYVPSLSKRIRECLSYLGDTGGDLSGKLAMCLGKNPGKRPSARQLATGLAALYAGTRRASTRRSSRGAGNWFGRALSPKKRRQSIGSPKQRSLLTGRRVSAGSPKRNKSPKAAARKSGINGDATAAGSATPAPPLHEKQTRLAEFLKYFCGARGDARKWTCLAAERGSVRAQFNLATSYHFSLPRDGGSGSSDDNARRAFSWYARAAALGHTKAMFNMGGCYLRGLGTPRDEAKALDCFSRAAAGGDERAQLVVARCYENGIGVQADTDRAMNWLLKSAQQQNADAQFILASYLLTGLTPPDDALGRLRRVGTYTPSDPPTPGRTRDDKASSMSPQSPSGDISESSAVVVNVPSSTGLRHETATSQADAHKSQRKPREAVEWYQRSAELGNPRAQYVLGVLREHGVVLSQDPRRAASWYSRAANGGHPEAQLALALCLSRGFGMPSSETDSARWLECAAGQGLPMAAFLLGQAFAEGKGVTPSKDTAFRWYLSAARGGSPEAQLATGRCYRHGIGVSRDSALAFNWLEKAAEQGSADAQYLLGQSFERGTGTDRDLQRAMAWYRRAADGGNVNAKVQIAIKSNFSPA